MNLTDSTIMAESGGNRFARNPRSSAFGPGQFINSTWLDVLKRNRPDLAQGRSDAELLAMRSDPDLAAAMTGAYGRENAARLTAAGFDASPGNTYLAHFAGPAGALKILQADTNAPAAAVLGPEVAKANPFLVNMTAGELRSWADKKMGAPIPPAPIPTSGAMSLPLPFPANAMASAQPAAAPQAGPGPGMLAAAGLASGDAGLLAQPAGQPQMAMAAPGQPPGTPPMFRPPRDRLQAAALGVPPGTSFDLAGLMAGGFAPRPMTDAEQQAWFARQNPMG